MIDVEKKLKKIKALDSAAYENLEIDRLTLYGFYVLEKNKIPLYFDNVVLALFFTFPEKFSMATFTQYPDTNRVKNSVNRIAGKFGTHHTSKKWLTGSVKHGFKITSLGQMIIEQTEGYFKNPNTKKLHSTGRTRGKTVEEDLNDIINSDLYKEWSHENAIERHTIYNFFRIIETSDSRVIKHKFEELYNKTRDIKDKNIQEFIKFLKDQVNNILKNKI